MLIAFLCVNSSLWAQKEIPAESDTEGAKIAQTAQFKEFIEKYIAAVNAKDQKALRALYDPVSQAAMAKDKKGVAQILDAAVDEKIPAKHEIIVSMIGPKEPLLFENLGAVYAVRPTAFVQIDSSTTSMHTFSGTTIGFYMAQAGGKWYEVWANPPNEKKLEAAMQAATQAMQRKQDEELQEEKAVKTSGITDYKYQPHPKDDNTWRYTWLVRMTASDSEKDKYEIVQIDQPDGGSAKTTTLVWTMLFHPKIDRQPWLPINDNGFVAFKLEIGKQHGKLPADGELLVELEFTGLGKGGSPWGDWIHLPGTRLGDVVATEKGAPLADGTLRLIRFNTMNADGRKFVTDVVLRPTHYATVGWIKGDSSGKKMEPHWFCAPSECSNPMTVPAGYSVTSYGDGEYSVTRTGDRPFGSIFITFQAKGTMDPETVPGSREAPMKIKGRQFYWRVYSTEADGKPIIRKEVLMLNFLPRHRDGDQADYIWLRVDAPTQQAINALAPVAHGIIRDGL